MLGGGVGSPAALFGIWLAVGYDVYSSTNSSPQTTELFASDRADTLWKYVRLGGVQVIALSAFASKIEGSPWPLIGGLTAAGIMHLMYMHALRAGQRSASTQPQMHGAGAQWPVGG